MNYIANITKNIKLTDFQKTLFVYSCILLTMFCWSFSYIASKIALQTFTVNALIVTRFLIASLIFLILLYFKGFPRFSKKDHFKIICTSFAFPFAYYYLETMALSYTTATEASVLSAIIPVVVLILSAIFLREKITLIATCGVIFSFIGILVLIFGNPGQKFQLNGNFLGNTLMLGSVLSFSIYMIITRSLGGKYTAFEITSVQTIYGTILFCIFCFCITPHKFQIKSIGIENICAVLFLSIFATIVAFLCYNFALAKISATKASLFVNSVPVITSIAAWSILHEQLTMIQLTGGFIAVMAVTVTCVYKKS
jgi:drug/metabolite transporter (DMT)-like permease